MRTVEWNYDTNKLQMIDQRLLPTEYKVVTFVDVDGVATSIRDMYVRGAPAIGATAARRRCAAEDGRWAIQPLMPRLVLAARPAAKAVVG